MFLQLDKETGGTPPTDEPTASKTETTADSSGFLVGKPQKGPEDVKQPAESNAVEASPETQTKSKKVRHPHVGNYWEPTRFHNPNKQHLMLT